MKIKRFIAASMRDAIRQVREEQGPDAVILSNRRVDGGIEVVAATDYDAALAVGAGVVREGVAPIGESRARPAPAVSMEMEPSNDGGAMSFAETLAARSPVIEVRPSTPSPAIAGEGWGGDDCSNEQRQVSATRTEQRVVFEQSSNSEKRPHPVVGLSQSAQRHAATVPTTPALSQGKENSNSSDLASLKSEMQSMRRFMEQQLSGLAWNDLKTRNPIRADVVRRMTSLGVEMKLAREIASELAEDVSAERARFLPMALLARRIPAFKHEWLDAGGVVALVGATGVGKTTTIAKLAARYVQNWGLRDVALVTTDHFRIGAQEQLFTYGRLLGVPVPTADNHHELCLALDKLRDRKLVLIDTAGMSPRDSNLEKQFAMLSGLPVPNRTALVVSASSQTADLDDQYARFAAADPSAVILTKLDEATRSGTALSAIVRHGLPMAYVADGQRVPEDLSAARPDQLVLRAMSALRKAQSQPDDDELSLQFAGAAHA